MRSNTIIRYLLALYQLSDGGQPVRSAQVARCLAVSRSSVAKTLASLAQQQLIEKEYYGQVTLTPLGARLARQYWAEQQAMQSLFQSLGVPPQQAAADALSAAASLSPQAKAGLLALSTQNASSF